MAGKNFQLAFEIGGKIAASLPKSFRVAAQAVSELTGDLTELKKQQSVVQQLQNQKTKVGQTALEYHKAAARVEELQQQLSQTASPTRAMIREFERAKTKSSNLRDSLRSQRSELDNLKRSYGGADTSAKGLALRSKELKAGMDRTREAQARSVEQVLRYKSALSEASQNVRAAKKAQDELNRSLERQKEIRSEKFSETKGKLVSSGIQTAAVTGGVFMAAKKAADYNRENTLIGNTANMTSKEVDEMGRSILQTANATGQFADDIQSAQGYLVAAGQDWKEAQANLQAIGRTATATDSDILDVAKSTFTLSDALKINPKDMQTALDILVQAGKEGNFEFNDMAKTLPVLGAQFQALKMGGTEAAATMGAALQIARKGASGSDEAANNMNNFMAKIMSPETLKKAKKNFGVDLYAIITKAQTTGKNPFEAAMKQVIKMTKNGNQKLLGDLFGDMQVQNFVRPMVQNYKEYEEIKKKTLSAHGVVDTDFAKMMKDNSERLKQLRIQTDNAANAFGQALQPALSASLAVFLPLVTGIANFVAKNPSLVSAVALTTMGIMGVRTAILAARLAMIAFTLASNMSPFGWLKVAVTALVYAGVLLYQNWDKIKEYALKLWPEIKAIGEKALNGLKWVFMNFTPVGWIIKAFQAGKDVISKIDWGASGSAIIQTLIDGIKSKAGELVDEVKDVFASVREYLPFSDAKVGPFSELTKSGAAIMGTLALGVKSTNSLQGAISEQFDSASNGMELKTPLVRDKAKSKNQTSIVPAQQEKIPSKIENPNRSQIMGGNSVGDLMNKLKWILTYSSKNFSSNSVKAKQVLALAKTGVQKSQINDGVQKLISMPVDKEPHGIGAASKISTEKSNGNTSGGVSMVPNFTYSPVIHLPAGNANDTRTAADAALKHGADDFEKRMQKYTLQQRRLSYE